MQRQPARIGLDVFTNHALAGMGRRAATTHRRADQHAVHRLVEELGHAAGGAAQQVLAAGVQQQHAAQQAGVAGLDALHDGRQHVGQRCAGCHQRQHLVAAGIARLDPLALGDVGDHRQRAGIGAVVAQHRVGGQRCPQITAVLAPEFELMLLGHALAPTAQVVLRQHHVRLAHEFGHRPARHLGHRVAQHLRHFRVDESRHRQRVDGPDAFAGGLDDAAVAALAVAQRGLGLQALGDVFGQHQARVPAIEADRLGDDFDVKQLTVAAPVAPVPAGRAPRQRRGQIGQQRSLLTGLPDVGQAHGQKLGLAVAIACQRRLIDGQKIQRLAVVNPHRPGVAVKQQAIAGVDLRLRRGAVGTARVRGH